MHFEIDDTVFRDSRFMRLVAKVGDPEKAMGMCMNAWMVAFEFWKNKQPIPRSSWVERCLSDLLIEVGLARYEGGDSIYVCGSEQMHSWYHQRKEAGKKGGLKSQENKRSGAKAALKQTQANRPSVPVPVPNTVPNTEKCTARSSPTQADPPAPVEVEFPEANTPDPTQRLVAWWCQEYKRRYGVQYRVTGKDVGILKRLRGGLGSDAVYDRVVTAYLDMPDQWFVNKRHDVTTLESNLAKVSQFEQSGQMVTQSQIRELDRNTTNKALIEKVRRGEV